MSVNKISGPKLSRPAFAIDVNVKNLMLQMFYYGLCLNILGTLNLISSTQKTICTLLYLVI